MTSCKDCKYAHEHHEHEGIVCRRYPPFMRPSEYAVTPVFEGYNDYRPTGDYTISTPDLVSAFPDVSEDWWCGEYVLSQET